MKEKVDFKTRGFTFTELLVVVSIGTMLVGAMLPALNTAQDTMKAAVCLGNMHQWGVAIDLYVADQRDYYPYDGSLNQPCAASNTKAWFNLLPPYINQPRLCDLYSANTPPTPGMKSIFICPSATNTTVSPTSAQPYFNYALSTCLHEEGLTTVGFRRSRMVKPATTIIFCEEPEDNFPETNGEFDTVQRHSGGSHFVMGDGHAEWIALSNFCRTGNALCPPPLSNFPWDSSGPGGDWHTGVVYHWWFFPFANTSPN
jgi:prepilin-type N-terminal cleavage/methylation domain-containing protein/prepilin-type processing-associated H-X9-DG protein